MKYAQITDRHFLCDFKERSLNLSKKPTNRLGQAKKSLTSANKEELKRLLKEYLNSRK